jgi:hypothetical protein
MLGEKHTGDTWDLLQKLSEVLEATPTHFHFKREKAEQHLAVSVVRERVEEDRSSNELITWEETKVTVRVCPFSVGACPIVIFLRNLSLVSNTTVEKKKVKQFLRKRSQSLVWWCTPVILAPGTLRQKD